MQDQIIMSDFMPHGHCYFWEPYILWSHAISDSIIALAYLVIPFSLFYIYNKRRDFSYRWMVILFAVFIFGCGVTHIFDVINIWYPIYRLDSLARIITALASIGTAIVLIRFTPHIIALPTFRQWAKVNEELNRVNKEFSVSNEELMATNEELKAANEELTLMNEQLAAAKDKIQKLSDKALLQSQQQYQDLAESISDIFFAVDSSFRFTYWNKTSEKYSGMKSEQVLGKSMYELYPHLKDTALDQFYHRVIQSGKPDKFIQTLEERYGNTIHEVNAYPSAEGMTVITVDITSMHKAKELVEEQKKQLELALWGADLGMWDRDLINDKLYCDERYTRITGLNAEEKEINFQDWKSRVHPDDVATVIEKLKKHEAGETSSYQEQYRMINPAGKYVWVMSSAKVVARDESGKPLRIVGVLQDVSEIKQTEETNRFFKYLIDHMDDPIYWIDPHQDFRFAYVNKAACRHYGMSEEKLLSMSLPDWDPSFTREKCIGHWEKIKKEKSLHFETVHLTTLGKTIPVEISTSYLRYGEKEYFGGHFKDISERKANENKIIELQHRLEGIIDSAMDAIITTDEEQNILIFNKSAEQMFGYTAQKAIGQPLSLLIPSRFHLLHQTHVTGFSGSGKSSRKMGSNLPVFGVTAQGKEFPIEASISQVEVGKYKYFTVIMRDISLRLQGEQQEKDLNKELIRQNEQLQQFGFIASHNLRSPVASLLGLVDVIEEEKLMDDINIQAVKRIRHTAEKMDEIIQDLNQILEYQSSINAKREWVEMEHILESNKVLIASTIQSAEAEIITEFKTSKIYTVKSYLQSIFHNLISNAIKYRDPSRPLILNIRSWMDEKEILIEFSDNGLGIDLEKYRDRIFGLYKRFHYHVEGRGMGLHLVKTQIEALNGKVVVESNVGKGTTFTLSLPNVKEQEITED